MIHRWEDPSTSEAYPPKTLQHGDARDRRCPTFAGKVQRTRQTPTSTLVLLTLSRPLTVSRDILWAILVKCVCLQVFHTGMVAHAGVGDLASDPFEVKDTK